MNTSSVAKEQPGDAKTLFGGEQETPTAEQVRKYRLSVQVLYERTDGASWEPRVHTNEFIEWMLQEGWLRRVDGRCGFEAFKDAMLSWTDAAHAALSSGVPLPVCEQREQCTPATDAKP